jgi:small subunit ribosomal protein S6
MKKYEMMFIVKSTVEENVASAAVENIKSIVTSMKGEITKFDDLGNKKLAYPIKK